MLDIVILFGMILTFLLGWNNSGVIMGSSYGCGIFGFKKSSTIIAFGVIIGVLMEGNKMSHTIFGGLVNVDLLSLKMETTMVHIIFITSIAILLLFSVLRVPSSLSLITTGASAGAILGSSLSLEVNYAILLVISWLLLPLLSGFLTMITYRPITMFVSKFSLSTADFMSRLSSILGIFVVSYVLGANNVGFINGLYASLLSQYDQTTLALAVSLSTVMGVILFGRAMTEVIGEKFVVLSPQGVSTSMVVSAVCVWLFTQWGIPMSVTHVLIGSIIGAALARHIVLVNRRILYGIMSGAAGSALLSWVFAFAIMKILF